MTSTSTSSQTTSHIQHIHEIVREDDYNKLLSYINDNNISSLTTYYSNPRVSPMFSAIYRNNLKIVKLLFSIGFPKNQLGVNECTMLSHAMKYDKFEVFKYLLSVKVNFGDLDIPSILGIMGDSYYRVFLGIDMKRKYNRSNGYLIKNFKKYIDVDLNKYKITRNTSWTLKFIEWLMGKGAILDLTYDLLKYGHYDDKSFSLINSLWDLLSTNKANPQLLKNNFVNFYLRNEKNLVISQTVNTIKIPKWDVEEVYHTIELNLPKKIKHQKNVYINGDGYEFKIHTGKRKGKFIIDMNGTKRFIR